MSMLCLPTLLAAGFTAPALRAPLAAVRPMMARHASPVALDLPALHGAADTLGTANLLAAQIFGLDTNPYGGTSTFSQSASGEAGDLNLVLLIGVLFPTVLTAVVYRENIAEIFAEPPEVEPPKGWRKVPSRSRPGKFSYENIKTKEVYSRLPPSAFE
jgi:hypothetical protein